jgi:hypothetical protein
MQELSAVGQIESNESDMSIETDDIANGRESSSSGWGLLSVPVNGAIPSVSRSWEGSSAQLMHYVDRATGICLTLDKLIKVEIDLSFQTSAVSEFGEVWRMVANQQTKDPDDTAGLVNDRELLLANAVASNDVSDVGRLLGASKVDRVLIRSKDFPTTLLRKPEFCSLLDLAAATAAVDVAKYLLEFHEAMPTRETLKMALSSGNLELIRLFWARLPELEQKSRLDLLEVASDFHQVDVVAWLFRDGD